jgi:hypothetical protein
LGFVFVSIPQEFPKSVRSGNPGFMGFPGFPYSVISIDLFGSGIGIGSSRNHRIEICIPKHRLLAVLLPRQESNSENKPAYNRWAERNED